MSKTYEMWASDDFIDGVKNKIYGETGGEKSDYHCNRVTITIHEERRVTISESEFDEIYAGIFSGTSTCFYNELKEKLFNKQD